MIQLDEIYNEDCLIAMQRIPDNSVDAVICDLPYGTTACPWDSVIPFGPLWEQYRRIVKPKGNIILFASGQFMFSLYASQPNLYRYDLIWQKSRCGSPLTAKYMPLKMHEHILVFGEPASVYHPQMTYEGKPYKKEYERAYGDKNNHRYGIKGIHAENHGERHPTSVLKFGQKWRRQDQLHPTQKPVELCRWLVRTYSGRGDTILDNAIGSGTTAVAAIREGRHFIGFETNREYFEIARKRIERERRQMDLFNT